jgi:cell division protein FtsB
MCAHPNYNTFMRDLQERKRYRNFLLSPVTSVILLIVVIFLLKSNYNIYKKNQIAKINREESDRKLALLREKSDRLTDQLKKLETERGVEEELRNKFQITKSGEEVLVVVDEEGEGQVKNEPVEEEQTYWQRFISFFEF